jgi:hypothetical protein
VPFVAVTHGSEVTGLHNDAVIVNVDDFLNTVPRASPGRSPVDFPPRLMFEVYSKNSTIQADGASTSSKLYMPGSRRASQIAAATAPRAKISRHRGAMREFEPLAVGGEEHRVLANHVASTQ